MSDSEGNACPYDGTAYCDVPGYDMGRGCPVCGGISFSHVQLEPMDRARIEAHIELLGPDTMVTGYLKMVLRRLA